MLKAQVLKNRCHVLQASEKPIVVSVPKAAETKRYKCRTIQPQSLCGEITRSSGSKKDSIGKECEMLLAVIHAGVPK